MTAHAHDDAVDSGGPSLNRLALSATVHCLTGCAIGEVLGMVIGTGLDWSNGRTIAISIVVIESVCEAKASGATRRSGIPARTSGRLVRP